MSRLRHDVPLTFKADDFSAVFLFAIFAEACFAQAERHATGHELTAIAHAEIITTRANIRGLKALQR